MKFVHERFLLAERARSFKRLVRFSPKHQDRRLPVTDSTKDLARHLAVNQQCCRRAISALGALALMIFPGASLMVFILPSDEQRILCSR